MKIDSQLNSKRVLFFPVGSSLVLGSLEHAFISRVELLSHDEIEVFFFTISVTCRVNNS